MASVGGTITATDYNTVQSRINTIMNTDYGQSLSSSQVAVGDTITDTQFDNLRSDITKAYAHQQGSNPTITNVADGDTIEAATINQYATLMTTVETNKFSVGSGQTSIESGTSSTRTSQWGGGGGGVVTHTVTVNFSNATARTQFFNAGGQIRFSASRTGGSGSKNTDWTNLLSAMGTVVFNYTSTSASSGSGSTKGGLDLTTSYQKIFQKNGSGNYAENDYNIYARYTGSGNKNIQFRIQFRDDDTGDQQGGFKAGAAQDEYVTGTLQSVVQHRRATGSNVETPAPSYTNNSNL